jgi:hypothetical protein
MRSADLTARRQVHEPPALHDRAMDNLAFIRETMERAGAFTAVSGWGMVASGGIAAVAALATIRMPIDVRWLAIWLASAAAALLVSVVAIGRKARAAHIPLLSGPARKLLLSFTPPILVGAALTLFLARSGLIGALPGVWLMLYGTAVIAGGMYSVRIVPVMGFCFLAVGLVTLALPAALANAIMGTAFGVLHVAFGIAIARRHGG